MSLALPGGDLGFFALVLASLFAIFFALAHLLTVVNPRHRILARAVAARDRIFPSRLAGPSVAARARLDREFRPTRLDSLASRLLPNAESLRRRLARAGSPLTLGSFAILAVALSLAFAAGLEIFGFRALVAGPLGLVLGVVVLQLYLVRLIGRRIKAFLKQLPDAIGLMVRGLKSGLPVSETILVASREIANPLGEELRRIADQIQLGRPLEAVMQEAAERIDLPEIAFMAVALTIQRETGGNLAEMLENLDSILRRRRNMQLKVKAFSAEARASALIIGALPFVLLGLLSVVNAEYVATLFTTYPGHILLAAAGGCLVVGIGTLIKLTKFQI